MLNRKPLGSLASVAQIREYLAHQDAILDALKQLDHCTGSTSCGRLGLLNDAELATLRGYYNNLSEDVRTLLVHAVVCHDIGKFVHKTGHAALGSQLLGGLGTEAIAQSAVVKELGWQGDAVGEEDSADAAKFLTTLVEFHEVYGNYATGEQSLLGFVPIVERVDSGCLLQLLDALLILGAMDAAATGKEGYLYSVKVRQYTRARDHIRNAPKDESLESKLIEKGADEEELTERVMALAYSYGSKKFYDEYSDELGKVRSQFIEEVDTLCDDQIRKSFYDALSRMRKMAYALKHFGLLTGVPAANPPVWPPKEYGAVETLIRLLWILALPVRSEPEMIFEIDFPHQTDEATETVRERLKDGAWRDHCHLLNADDVTGVKKLLQSGKTWRPLGGLEIARSDRDETTIRLSVRFV